MATIKTTGTGLALRVLTKTASEVQRVSCSCCEEVFCCPYPAAQLGIGYTQDDLPDTIDVEGLILGVPTRIIVSRSGLFYGPINQSIFNGAAFSEFIFVETNDFSEVVWFRNTTNGEPIGLGEPCLFQTIEEGAAILDTFADAYQVIGPVSGTVTRTNLCVWSGEGLTLSNFGYQWKVNGRNKSGNQNTPVGPYADGYSVAL
jgi:hypothetical protein